MKRALFILVGVVALVGGYFVWKATAAKQNGQSPYRMGAVDRGTVQMVVTATGTVSAVTTVTVGSQVSGTIKEILVDFNSPVKKGQVVARLDPTFLQASVSENEAALERAEATLKQANRDVARISDLAEKNLAPRVDLDNALTSLDMAKASVRQAQAALQRAKVNLAYSVIQSPTDGVVISRNVDVGQTVAASMQAPTLFTIAQDLRKMQIETNIDEADVGRLEEGMEALFTVDSYPDLTFHASVGQIRYASKVDQSVVTYPVILTVDNPELKLRPGMTANVTVVTARQEDALRIPASALRFRPADFKTEKSNGEPGRAQASGTTAKGRGAQRDSVHTWDKSQRGGGESRSSSLVFVRGQDGKPQMKRIHVGINDGTFAELKDTELALGDSVILGMTGTSALGVKMMPGMGGPTGPRR
jgi:HlyD family secretion protein